MNTEAKMKSSQPAETQAPATVPEIHPIENVYRLFDDLFADRWTLRTNCNLPILIRYRDTWSMHCTITDISRAGVCLDTGPIHLAPGAVVELVIDADSASDQPNPLVAMVIHSSQDRATMHLFQAFADQIGQCGNPACERDR